MVGDILRGAVARWLRRRGAGFLIGAGPQMFIERYWGTGTMRRTCRVHEMLSVFRCVPRWPVALRLHRCRNVLLMSACWGASWFLVQPSQAAEPLRRFVDALRAEREPAVLLRYLDRLEASPRLDDAQRPEIAYHRGVTQLEAAMREGRPAVREQAVEQAVAVLQGFLDSHAEHMFAPSARLRLADTALWRARQTVQQAASKGSEEAAALRASALQRMDEAQASYAATQQALHQQLQRFPKALDARRDAEVFQARRVLQAEYVMVQLAQAVVDFEASTLHDDETTRTERLQRALERFQSIATKYRRRLEAASARYYIALVHLRHGDCGQALGYLAEILEAKSTQPAVLQLQTRALPRAMRCWLEDDPPKWQAVVRHGQAWLRMVGRRVPTTDEALQIQWYLAKAYHLAAPQVGRREAQQYRRLARRLAGKVAGVSGAHRQQAKDLLAELGHAADDVLEQDPTAWREPESYADALQLARGWMDDLQTLRAARVSRSQPLAEAPPPSDQQPTSSEDACPPADKDGATPPKSAADQAAMQSRVEQLEAWSRKALNLALELAGPEDSPNEVRTLLAFLELNSDRPLAAAIVAWHVMRAEPGSPVALQAAPIALSGWAQAYEASRPAQRVVLRKRLLDASEYIVRQWPDQEVADRATLVVAKMMAQDGRYDAAQTWLQKLPEASPQRYAAQVFLGQMLLQSAPDGERQAAPVMSSESQGRATQAEAYLARAWDGLLGGPPSDTSLQAALLLISARQNIDGDMRRAESLLSHPTHGPLTMLLRRDPLLKQHPELIVPLCRTALQHALDRFRAAGGGREPAQACTQLIEQFSVLQQDGLLDASGQVALYAMLAEQSDVLLDAVTGPAQETLLGTLFDVFEGLVENSQDPRYQVWTSTVVHQLVGSLRKKGADPAVCQRFYAVILPLDEVLFAELKAAPNGSDSDRFARLQAGRRLALSYRGLAQYEQSVDVLKELLAATPQYIALQILAAETYQQWAADSGHVERYKEAIAGSPTQDPKSLPVIWGWARICNALARSEQHVPMLLEARYELARSRRGLANSLSGEQRTRQLRAAKRDLRLTYRLVPGADEPPWRDRYDALVRKIQSQLGEPPVGLSHSKKTSVKK